MCKAGPVRRHVRCWMCGKRARRVQSIRGLDPHTLDKRGRVKVVLRRRTVKPYGACGGKTAWGSLCPQPMLRHRDALMVLRAAIEFDRGGGNKHSEFD